MPHGYRDYGRMARMFARVASTRNSRNLASTWRQKSRQRGRDRIGTQTASADAVTIARTTLLITASSPCVGAVRTSRSCRRCHRRTYRCCRWFFNDPFVSLAAGGRAATLLGYASLTVGETSRRRLEMRKVLLIATVAALAVAAFIASLAWRYRPSGEPRLFAA